MVNYVGPGKTISIRVFIDVLCFYRRFLSPALRYAIGLDFISIVAAFLLVR